MNKLIKAMENEQNENARTANGAKSLKSSLNACVDLFGSIGSMRARSDHEVISMFTKAFAEDSLTALRIVFFARDIRGGLGERKVFRTIMEYMVSTYPSIVEKNFEFFPIYGRWDDLYCLEKNPPLWNQVVEFIRDQLEEDIEITAKDLKNSNTNFDISDKYLYGIIRKLKNRNRS